MDVCWRSASFARLVIVKVVLLFCVPSSHTQITLLARPDASQPKANTLPDPGRFEDVDISWRKLPKRVLRDQKDIWLFPAQLVRGRYLLPTLGVAGTTAGLVAADPHAMPYFRRHAGNLDDVNDVFDSNITTAATAVVPISLLLVGYARHDTYAVNTSLLAGEAYLNGAIVDLALKGITQRNRPSGVPPGSQFNDTFF